MVAKPVSVHAAKTNLSRLIERACAGEDVVIARGKVPVVRLVAVVQRPIQRKFGAMKGNAKTNKAFFEPLSDQELNLWEG